MDLQKVISKKIYIIIIFLHLESHWRKEQDPKPDPYQYVTDPEHCLQCTVIPWCHSRSRKQNKKRKEDHVFSLSQKCCATSRPPPLCKHSHNDTSLTFLLPGWKVEALPILAMSNASKGARVVFTYSRSLPLKLGRL
jgi:radical SAM protein with 4Fe4S-binding SPASM domain